MTVADSAILAEQVDLKQKLKSRDLKRFLVGACTCLLALGVLVCAGFYFTPYAPNTPDFLNRLSPPSQRTGSGLISLAVMSRHGCFTAGCGPSVWRF